MKGMAALGLGALVLSACSGGGSGSVVANTSSARVSTSPSVSKTVSASVAATPTVPTTGPNVLPGAKPPVQPEGAKAHTAEGAVLFAASIPQALDWAYSTTDSTLLRQFYSTKCTGCFSSARGFEEDRDSGLHYSGGHITVLSLSQLAAVRAGVKADYAIDVKLAATALRVVRNGANALVDSYPPMTVTFEYSLSWTPTGWLVVKSARLVK